MLEKTRVKIEAFKTVVGCNWFGKKECRENKISPETLVKNVPELIVDKEIITCEVSEVEYLETIEKYGDRMDSKGFGGVGYYWAENGKYYNKRCTIRYKFPE